MAYQMKRIKTIKSAIKAKNIVNLKQLAIKHGFVSDKLRKKAWPLVLGINNVLEPTSKANHTNTDAYDSIECRQIEQDIKRTSHYNSNTDKHKSLSMASLSRILHGIFDDNVSMHYLQGFNDVTSVLYAVCNNVAMAQNISTKVAETLMSDFIMDNKRNVSEISVSAYKLIFNIIECDDPRLMKLLKNRDFIAISISWLITWFAHQITDIKVLSRIYDYCLCSDKSISAYLSAAVIIYLKDELLALNTDRNNTSLFQYFNDLQWDTLDFNQIIDISQNLYNKYNEAMHCCGTEFIKDSNPQTEHNGGGNHDIQNGTGERRNERTRDIWSFTLFAITKM